MYRLYIAKVWVTREISVLWAMWGLVLVQNLSYSAVMAGIPP